MKNLVSVSLAIYSLLVLGVLWVALPPGVPPDPSWPSPGEQATARTTQELARHVSASWERGAKEKAWAYAQTILESDPHSLLAQRIRHMAPSLAAASERERLIGKWTYEEQEASGWGRLNQGQIAAETKTVGAQAAEGEDSDVVDLSPPAPPAQLVVRTGSLARFTAVFLVPTLVPPTCQSAQGCVVHVKHGPQVTSMRLLPVKDQPGWLQFSDPARMIGWLAFSPLSIAPEEGPSWDFETTGVDRSRLGLVP